MLQQLPLLLRYLNSHTSSTPKPNITWKITTGDKLTNGTITWKIITGDKLTNGTTLQWGDARAEPVVYFHFHGMLAIPCWLLLLHVVPVLWFIGLPGPPEDSLKVPRDGGLLAPVMGIGPLLASLPGAEEGSMAAAAAAILCFGSFFPSAMKLPTTTCSRSISNLLIEYREGGGSDYEGKMILYI